MCCRYLCRSVEYEEQGRQCILSDEDSISQREHLRSTGASSSSGSIKTGHHLYDLVCLDTRKCFSKIKFKFNVLPYIEFYVLSNLMFQLVLTRVQTIL